VFFVARRPAFLPFTTLVKTSMTIDAAARA